MTQGPLPDSALPADRRWTVWARCRGHWRLEYTGNAIRCDQEGTLRAGESVETLVLPPGETPLMCKRHCRRRE